MVIVPRTPLDRVLEERLIELFDCAGTPHTLDTLEAFRCENAPFVFHFVCAKRLFAKTDFDRFGTYKMTHV